MATYRNLVTGDGDSFVLSLTENLCLESAETENNLYLEGESSGAVGPNLMLDGWRNLVMPPAPVWTVRVFRSVRNEAFPPSLLLGRVVWRVGEHVPSPLWTVIRFKTHFNEAFPPSLLQGRTSRHGKHTPILSKTYRQAYRVADDSLERWELYLEEDQLPDFDGSGQPVATSATLPFTHGVTPPGPGGTTELWIVVRKRNRYNLLSHNLHPTILQIDSVGEEEMGGLSNPEILRVLDGDSGEIVVFARYPYGVDRNPADSWELYVKLGSTPDPDVDVPVASADFGAPAADYLWKATASGLTPGSTYRVVVVVRRSSESGDGLYGTSAVWEITLAQSFDIDGNDAMMFGGTEHEIGT